MSVSWSTCRMSRTVVRARATSAVALMWAPTGSVGRRAGSGRERVRREHAGDPLRPHEDPNLTRIVEVPSAVRSHQREDHPGDEVGGLREIDTVEDASGMLLALEVREQERGDEGERRFLLRREQRQKTIGLGHE